MQSPPFATQKLSSRAVISVAGEGASDFLNNLITADIEGLKPGMATYAALLQPQGKILFDFFIVAADGRFLIDCSARQKADLIKRLTFYKLRAKVTFDDSEAEVGVTAETSGADISYMDPRVAGLGARLITRKGSLPEAGGESYRLSRIRLGLADSDEDIGSGELFPHEANLDQLGAVSFAKGCYIGQEVVSRMEHRGTARSRILPVHVAQGAPAKGSEILADGKAIGSLLSASGSDALALIRLDKLKDAAEAGAGLLTQAGPVHVRRPSWARFDMTLPKEDAVP